MKEVDRPTVALGCSTAEEACNFVEESYQHENGSYTPNRFDQPQQPRDDEFGYGQVPGGLQAPRGFVGCHFALGDDRERTRVLRLSFSFRLLGDVVRGTDVPSGRAFVKSLPMKDDR